MTQLSLFFDVQIRLNLQVRMLSEVQAMLRSETLKLPGFTIPKEDSATRVDVAKESADFGSTLRFLKVAAGRDFDCAK